MIGFLLTTLIFICVLFGVSFAINIHMINVDWEKHRCRPDIMLTAPLYGHDLIENFEFCLKFTFDLQAGGLVFPFYSYFSYFVQILITLLGSINSIRMTFATIVGSFTKIFSEFFSRISALFYAIQGSAFRIKFLMGRIFATMNSIMFIGMSGIKAGQNMGNTTLFKFLDFICFDPDTPVDIEGRGRIAIKDVVAGDIFKGTKDRVTSLFRFLGDGQTMCNLNGCIVSTNHYVLHNGKWIHAADHPAAVPAGEWAGGLTRPLICFNTSTHQFPVNGFVFRDYDETDDGDVATMEYSAGSVNGTPSKTTLNPGDYITCCHPDLQICLKDGSTAPAKDISLGTELSQGKVIGFIQKECTRCCWIDGEAYGIGTLIWRQKERAWRRAGEIVEPVECKPTMFISYMVSPSACIETSKGTMFRDYFEIHQPEMEDAYTKALLPCEFKSNESHMVQAEC
jgi:hypothetical protein